MNHNVATVDSTGKITAVGTGTAVIRAACFADLKEAIVNVTVTVTPYIPVTSVTVTPTSVTIHTGETIHLGCVVSPANVTNKNISWINRGGNVQIVNSNNDGATIKGLPPGTSYIEAFSSLDLKAYGCYVTVVAMPMLDGTYFI